MRKIPALLLLLIILVGCTQIIKPQPQKIAEPYRDLNSYLHGNWILLAESLNKDWYYDPESLYMEEEGPISFWLYWKPNKSAFLNANSSVLKIDSGGAEVEQAYKEFRSPFESSAFGPYLQKIDCSTNTYLEESLIDGRCESTDVTSQGMSKSDYIMCWRGIKPKTAIAYIKNRVCGRKFVLEKNVNYYLYQEGNFQKNQLASVSQVKNNVRQSVEVAKFYEVINNEFIITDTKQNIREMRVASYLLDKNLSHDADYLYQANCQARTDSFNKLGQAKPVMRDVSEPTSLTGVAFDRVCGNHGEYMKLVKSFSK